LTTLARSALRPEEGRAAPSEETVRDFVKKQIARIETEVVPVLAKLGVV
jgi:hypothetical protein